MYNGKKLSDRISSWFSKNNFTRKLIIQSQLKRVYLVYTDYKRPVADLLLVGSIDT